MLKVWMLIWQLPQYLISLLFWIVLRPFLVYRFKHNEVLVYAWRWRSLGSLSIGFLIIISERNDLGEPISEISMMRTLQHEYGHTIQSQIVGPFFLLAIGIPSFIRAIYFTIFQPNKGYYDIIFEKTADDLGCFSTIWESYLNSLE